MKLLQKTFLAKGKRGIASTALLGKKKVLIKETNPSAVVNTIAHEAEILQVVNKKKIGPKFIAFNNGQLVREFIEGEEIVPWITSQTNKKLIKSVLLQILDQCYIMDKIGINKLEMTHPHKHILVRKNKPVMIDFERAKKTQKPKNITQVCQWLVGTELTLLLEQKGIHISRDAMRSCAKEYKDSYDQKMMQKIITLVHDA